MYFSLTPCILSWKWFWFKSATWIHAIVQKTTLYFWWQKSSQWPFGYSISYIIPQPHKRLFLVIQSRWTSLTIMHTIKSGQLQDNWPGSLKTKSFYVPLIAFNIFQCPFNNFSVQSVAVHCIPHKMFPGHGNKLELCLRSWEVKDDWVLPLTEAASVTFQNMKPDLSGSQEYFQYYVFHPASLSFLLK